MFKKNNEKKQKEKDDPKHSEKQLLQRQLSVKDLVEEEKGKGVCDLINKYLLMIFDGVAFFGTSVFKLERLRGKKPSWTDKLGSKRDMFRWLVFSALFLYVFIYEFM